LVVDHGVERVKQGTIETELIEAKVYEDMCALFNLAVVKGAEKNSASTKPTLKLASALARATIMSTYHLYEAYLNGIALDFLIEKYDTLPVETIELLYEWDFNKNRSKYIKLRDKALQYPKIVTNSPHPPLQESNCAELKIVLSHAKWYRDAVAHPSAAWPISTVTNLQANKFSEMNETKETTFASLTTDRLTEIVDAVLVVIRKTDAIVSPTSTRVGWIVDRASDGLFPDTAFA